MTYWVRVGLGIMATAIYLRAAVVSPLSFVPGVVFTLAFCLGLWIFLFAKHDDEAMQLRKRVSELEKELSDVPVDAIGMVYQWSDFLGTGAIEAEEAERALNDWLDKQPGWASTANYRR